MQVKIKLTNGAKMPKYATDGSAGMDLSCLEGFSISPHGRFLVKTGISIELPIGYEAQIRPRSGKGLKEGLSVILGTIDSDYRGDIGIIVHNIHNHSIRIEAGERIAQMVITKYEQAQLIEVETLSETLRGSGGFGSTGMA